MKTHIGNLINAIALITLGLWGYIDSDTPSITALIPVFAGVILLALNKGVKNNNKIIGHVAVVVTLLVLIGLVKPFTGALSRDDFMAVARVSVMIITGLLAMVVFIKSFIDARKRKMS